MRSVPFGILCSAAAFLGAAPALAASDYYLVIDGVEGEAATSHEVESWSWGTSNPGTAVAPNLGSSGQDGVSRDTSPKVTASQNTQSLRESPTRQVTKLTASQNSQSLRQAAPAGDLDGDGRADLVALEQLDEVSGFTLTLAPGASARSMCASGKHIAHAHLVGPQGVIDLEDLVISSCSGGGGAGGMAMAVTGKTKEFKGHVTLLK